MKRFMIIVLAIMWFMPMNISAMELPKLSSTHVLLYEPESEEVLYERGIDEEIRIASLTKIMTTILAIESIEDVAKEVVITSDMLSEVPWDASVAGLKQDDRVSLKDLLYASMLPSGADATTALAHTISGNTSNYVESMNEFAKRLGLENTVFKNVTGYDTPGQSSSLRDVLKLLNYALKNPLFKEIYCAKEYTLRNGLKVKSTIEYYNRFVKGDTSKILGSKTGYTGASGMCMSALIRTNNKELLLLSTGAAHSYTWAYNLDDTFKIIKYLDDNYDDMTLIATGDELKTIPIIDSKEKEFTIIAQRDIVEYTEKEYDTNDFKWEYDGLDVLSYRNRESEKIGHIKYFYRDELIGEEDVFLTSSIHFSFEKFVKKHIVLLSIVAFSVIIIVWIHVKKRYKKSRRKMVKA